MKPGRSVGTSTAMKQGRSVYAVQAVWILIALLAVPASAKEKWINLTTKNFNIVGNAGEKQTTTLAQKLEQFRFVFSQLFDIRAADRLPVTVVVFKDDKTFKPFKPLYNGKPARLAGYFQPGRDEHTIALNINANEQRPMSVIYHEYTHVLTSYSEREWPLWLKEGVAELYSSFDVQGNEVTLGAPISHHVFLLRDSKFLPLRTLFDVGHRSPEYNERNKQGVFYAQCWALVHYLMFGDKNARQAQLVEFIGLLMRGKSVEQAFTQAFKTNYEAMEKDLRRYIGRNSYTINVYKMKSTQGEKEVSLRPLSEADTQCVLGNLLFRSNREEEAEPYFKRALELDGELARAHEGLGFVARRRNRFAEALEHFKQATARDSKNYLAHYYYAETLQREAMGGDFAGGLKPDQAKAISEGLKTAIGLMPSFPRSYYQLAHLHLVTNDNLDEGLQMIRAALRLEPQNKHFALVLAQIQLRKQDFPGAKKTLEPLLTAEDEPGVKSSAESMLSLIDSYTRRLERGAVPSQRDGSQPPPPEPANAPRLKRRDEATGNPTAPHSEIRPAPNTHPTLKIDGAESIGAIFSAIECEHGGMVLAVRTADNLIRFRVGDVTTLQFFSQNPELKLNIGCGPINMPAFIYFKKTSNPNTFAGDAVAVEFVK